MLCKRDYSTGTEENWRVKWRKKEKTPNCLWKMWRNDEAGGEKKELQIKKYRKISHQRWIIKKVERWWWWRACNLRQKKKRSIFCWLIQIELCLMQCVSPLDSPSKPKEHKNGCWNISVNLEYLQMNGAISIRFGSFQSQIVSKY